MGAQTAYVSAFGQQGQQTAGMRAHSAGHMVSTPPGGPACHFLALSVKGHLRQTRKRVRR